jgi:hypothetical protein
VCRYTNQLKYLHNTVLKALLAHKHSWPFNKPVDPVALNVPSYYNVIKSPMDFGTINERLEKFYYKKAEDCVVDIKTVFTNCYIYNKFGDIVDMAKIIEGVFISKLMEMPKEELEIPPEPPNTRGSAKGRNGMNYLC